MKKRNLFFDLFLGLYPRARHRLALVKAWFYDKKLGIRVEEDSDFKPGVNACADANRYSPTFYGRLERIVDYLKMGAEDVFVDIGCGKGKVVFFVGLQKIKKVVGVEVEATLIEVARNNLKNLKLRKSPIEFVHSDAVDFDMREGTVFYMFNPFGEKTLGEVLNKIKESLKVNPRNIRIVYYVPEYAGLLNAQDWLIREGEIENQSCLVWRNKL